MTTEILKELIKEGYIGVSEAIWLVKTCNIADIKTENTDNLKNVAKDLLEFIKAKASSSQNLTLEDELYFFSIQNHIETYVLLDDIAEEENEEETDEDESNDEYAFSQYSKEQLITLRDIEQKIISQGHKNILKRFMSFIESEYSIIFKSFNKSVYWTARGKFLKTIGFEDYAYYALSSDIKDFLNEVYNAAEPLVRNKVAEKELEILPDITNKFKSWTSEHKHKPNKTNLKQYLKDNDFKLSNTSIDKILSSVK